MEEKKFLAHLEDLRGCILQSAIGILVGVAASFLFISRIFNFIIKPYTDYLASQNLPIETALKSLSPADTFQMTLKAALLFGLAAASPWIAYQLWRFVSPALHKHEKKYAVIFCSSVIFFFLAGVLFAYLLVLPATLAFFHRYTTGLGIAPEWAIANYVSFVVTFLTAFGIVFEMPVAIIILSLLGIVTPKSLTKYRRHVIVGIFIVAAIATPGPDIISQLLMGVPMVALFELSVLAAKAIEIKRTKTNKALDYPE